MRTKIGFRTPQILLVFAVMVCSAAVAWAQPQPTSVTFSPASVAQGECATVIVEGGEYMTVDIQLIDPYWGPLTATPWLTLNNYGQRFVCTDPNQNLGTYIVTAIRNSYATDWVPVFGSVEVVRQPTALHIDPPSGSAGNSCKTLTFTGGAGMTIDMLMTFSSIPGSLVGWGPHALDANGQWSNCDDHYMFPQTLTVLAIRNAGAIGWVYLPEPVSWTLLPPQPTSLSFSPAMVTRGGSYNWYVGNGGGVTLDVSVTLNADPPWIGYGAIPLGDSGGDGVLTAITDPNQPLGHYHVTAIKNTLNSVWVPVDATVTVCPAQPDGITINPAIGTVGHTVPVNISGAGIFCNVRLEEVSGGGIAIDPVNDPVYPASQLAATFRLAPNAPLGPHVIRMFAGAGYRDFTFMVTSVTPPQITDVTPARSPQGRDLNVTFFGANLSGASVETSWSGLSVVVIASSSTTLTTLFHIADDAKAGSPAIVVRNLAGDFTTELFSITGPPLKREFIYLGDRMLAVDRP